MSKEIEAESENETGKKKPSKGRRRFREISRTGTFVRLLNGSKMHIEKMVRELRFSDPNFSTEAAAVRHYVNVGIAAETATSDLRNSLDNSIVRKSQKAAVRDEIKPLNNNIHLMMETMKKFTEENARLFSDVAKRTADLESKLDIGVENIVERLEKILMTGEQSFKNIAVLRSLFYIFLLGIETGKINTGKENLAQWNTIVKLAHEKAGEFADRELRELSTGRMESEVIKNITLQIFTHVKNATIMWQQPTPTTRIIRT